MGRWDGPGAEEASRTRGADVGWPRGAQDWAASEKKAGPWVGLLLGWALGLVFSISYPFSISYFKPNLTI